MGLLRHRLRRSGTCELWTMLAIGPVMMRPVMIDKIMALPSLVPICGRSNKLKQRA